MQDHALRDVVEDDREVAGRVSDRPRMRLDPRDRWLVVVRRDREEPTDAGEAGGLPREVDGMGGVVGSGARDDRHARADRAGDGLGQRELLVVGERRGLAGGAVHHDPLGAVGKQVLGEPHGLLEVD